MTRIVLIHGGFHAAWCWRDLVEPLRCHGFDPLAIDLPGHGARRDEQATADAYRDATLEVLRDGDVVLGHSLGGLPVTTAADVTDAALRHLIYLAAVVPGGDGSTIREERQRSGAASRLQVSDDGPPEYAVPSLDDARDYLYGDCPDDVVAWAHALLEPQSAMPHSVPIWLEHSPGRGFARTYIACREDRPMDAGGTAANAARLGVAPRWIDGSHSPFLSRPAELAALIAAAVAV